MINIDEIKKVAAFQTCKEGFMLLAKEYNKLCVEYKRIADKVEKLEEKTQKK